MLLNELKPGLKYEVDECGDSPATKRFVMTVSIENHTFEGSGASKKLAKQACARMALTTLYNFSFTPGLTMETDSEGQEDQKDQKVPGNPHNQHTVSYTHFMSEISRKFIFLMNLVKLVIFVNLLNLDEL